MTLIIKKILIIISWVVTLTHGNSSDCSAVTLNFDPCRDTGSIAQQKAYYLYQLYQTQLKGSFEEQYRSKCLNAINLESFSVTHPITEYHYTLYYYDQAGNLVKTVPPAGVNPDFSDTWQRQVAAARVSKQPLPRPHTMVTTYRYNTLNQVISQNTPDAGQSHFWYDRLGRLAISQNAKQQPGNNYSYTLYDSLGRITEVGQKRNQPQMTDAISRDTTRLRQWQSGTFPDQFGQPLIAEQVTYTLYDLRKITHLHHKLILFETIIIPYFC